MPAAIGWARSRCSVAGDSRRGGGATPHGKGVVATARRGERGRERDRAKRRRVGKQKFGKGEAEAIVYICLIGFGREAAEAKDKQKIIHRSEGVDRKAALGIIRSKRSGSLN